MVAICVGLVPGFRAPGSVVIPGQETQYGNQYFICITEIAPQFDKRAEGPVNVEAICQSYTTLNFTAFSHREISQEHILFWLVQRGFSIWKAYNIRQLCPLNFIWKVTQGRVTWFLLQCL